MVIGDVTSLVYDQKDDTYSDVDSEVEDTVLTFDPEEPVLDPPPKKLTSTTGGFYYMEDLSKREYPVYPSDFFKGSEGADYNKIHHLSNDLIDELRHEKTSKAELDKLNERYRAVIASWSD